MALRTCTVSFTGPSGVRHSAEVTAESIYEAAALGVSALKSDGWADVIAPGTELEVQVREPAICHRLTVQQIRRWCDGVAVTRSAHLLRPRRAINSWHSLGARRGIQRNVMTGTLPT